MSPPQILPRICCFPLLVADRFGIVQISLRDESTSNRTRGNRGNPFLHGTPGPERLGEEVWYSRTNDKWCRSLPDNGVAASLVTRSWQLDQAENRVLRTRLSFLSFLPLLVPLSRARPRVPHAPVTPMRDVGTDRLFPADKRYFPIVNLYLPDVRKLFNLFHCPCYSCLMLLTH